MKCGTTLIPAMLAALLPLLRAEPVQVALLPAKIVPEQAATLSMDEGIISHLADATRHQSAGAVIAVLNEERTAQEREEMELKVAREEMREKQKSKHRSLPDRHSPLTILPQRAALCQSLFAIKNRKSEKFPFCT
jgi:hypothetical protein